MLPIFIEWLNESHLTKTYTIFCQTLGKNNVYLQKSLSHWKALDLLMAVHEQV